MSARDEILAALQRAGYSAPGASALLDRDRSDTRRADADIIRSYIPPNPDGDEVEASIGYALGLAASAVERGRR
ncbi:hypothetical protein ACFW1M_11605 [Streptomyces inhibens]|uniref:hypothetical protein n=1 Tax=Streptomyces inhibens TaxID=2293571 RepID=UPI00369A25BE